MIVRGAIFKRIPIIKGIMGDLSHSLVASFSFFIGFLETFLWVLTLFNGLVGESIFCALFEDLEFI
jgi:hypothetical protein